MMNKTTHKPAVLQPSEGGKLMVLGQEITVKLSSSETGGDYYLFENAVALGSNVPLHVHSREDEILQVLEGELEVTLDGKTFKAPAGTVAFFPRNVVHGFGNVGDIPAKGRFLVIPGTNFEQFFGELSALPANQPPNMAMVMEIFGRYGLPIVAGSAS
jgi:quercetin dioxygenase-like cupin family protein